MTCDETWLHYHDPESKQESMEWKHHGSPATRKFKVQKSAGKVMASVFWDKDGLLLINYLQSHRTITGKYYSDLLVQLREAIKKKRRGKLARGVIFLQDNAPVHTSRVAQAALRDCGFQLLPHPPYSPDLAPSDFFLFGKLKKHLCGRRFRDNSELEEAPEAWFADQNKDFYLEGLKGLQKRLEKCIEVKGDYIEK